MGATFSTFSTDGFVVWKGWWIPHRGTRKREIKPDPIFDSLSDDDLIARLEVFDFMANEVDPPPSDCFFLRSPVYHFTPDTVVKSQTVKTSHEPYTTTMVASQTSIPVPKVRRYFYWRSCLWIFMEYIPGNDLKKAWPFLSFWNKLWVAWVLRGYVRQLRCVTLTNGHIPGPIDGSGHPSVCRGHYFTDLGAGPFASYSQMTSWFASKSRITALLLRQRAPHRSEAYVKRALSFDNSMPLVLTHGDISLGNVRLGGDGTVWLVDWGFSGVYPEWFEYSGMVAYAENKDIPRMWLWMAPFITGRHKSKHEFLWHISLALDNYGMGEE